jgi:CRP-like cAMP-binding protein
MAFALHPEDVLNGAARQIRRCPLFRNVDAAQVHAVLRDVGTRRLGRGKFYFRQGDRALEAYVLVQGRVKLIRTGAETRPGILQFVSPPEPFGHEALLGRTGHVVSAQASENSEALVWPATTLIRLMTNHPTIAHNSLRLMAEHIQGKWERINGLLTEPLERRVARALLLLGSRIGRPVNRGPAIELTLTHQDLAAFVGTTPYTMSRIFRGWRRLRIIDAGRGWVMIRPRRLAALVGEHGW